MTPFFRLAFATFCIAATAAAQTSMPQSESTSAPKPTVLFERNTDLSATPTTPVSPQAQPTPTAPPDITDTERSALRFTAYALDARITPATSRLAMRAQLTLRNDSATPLTYIALQISSSLTWESATLVADNKSRTLLPLAQHLLETDADHTGKASEAILTLPAPLAPNASLTLDTFYSGVIQQNATRLERIGAASPEGAESDWDSIGETTTALRGFGNVLWYPVASPQLFLGQGAQLFDAVGQTRLTESAAQVSLHLSVDYDGAPPIAAYFCGRRQPLKLVGDEVDGVPGITSATFSTQPLGFRTMSLFLIPERETLAPPQPGGWSLLATASTPASDETQLPIITATVQDAAVLLEDWLGPQPLSALTILDHPGQPFEDGPLLVAPFSALTAPNAASALTHSLTHAWVQTGSPWIDEGLAQFFTLLWTERSQGREAAIAQLDTLIRPLTLAEVAPEQGKTAAPGHPLPTATSELYYRRKAAAVWMMLRDITGDDALKLALQSFRTRPASHNKPEDDALIFEALLEKTYGKDLHWFFDDWVIHDRGLPDLTIVDVAPRELPAAPGKNTGWLIAVTARNDGAAVADVPLVIRSGSYSTTQRLRIPAFGSTTTRIVVEAPPTEVLLNDGTTPEQRASLHTRTITLHTR